jgi:lipid-A-disaccharide synthase
MRAAGVETLFDIGDLAVMGVPEVLLRLPFFKRVFDRVLDLARRRRPSAVVLVDFPEFNLRLAAAASRLGLKVIYYICPQVWAWRRGRIPAMARCVRRLISIFPFEAAHFAGSGLAVDFVGHPLVDEARAAWEAPAPQLPWRGEPRIALLPGSRMTEIDRILPPVWEAAGLLQRLYPAAGFMLAAPSPAIEAALRARVARLGTGPERWSAVGGQTRQVLRQARAALVASGTATLEAALMRCPMAVVYRTGFLTHLLARLLVRVPHVGMVNLVAGRRLCPELIQGRATPENMAREIARLLYDEQVRAATLRGFDAVRDALGPAGAEQKAAAIVAGELAAG